MSKTSRPDRKKHSRSKEVKEFEETTLCVDRVTRVVKGGRRMRFRAVVVVGDKKGKVGIGTGKSNEVMSAVQKAAAEAKRSMIMVPLKNGTLPHEIDTKYKSARIRLLPASEGTGVIAGGALRTVLEHAGVRNVLSKRYGSTNKLVNAQCIMKALSNLRGEYIDDSSAPVKQDSDDKETLKVKEVSKKDIGKDGTLNEKKAPKKESKESKDSKESKEK